MQKMGVKVGNSIVRAGMSRAAGGQPLVTGDGFVERRGVRYYDACRIIPSRDECSSVIAPRFID